MYLRRITKCLLGRAGRGRLGFLRTAAGFGSAIARLLRLIFRHELSMLGRAIVRSVFVVHVSARIYPDQALSFGVSDLLCRRCGRCT